MGVFKKIKSKILVGIFSGIAMVFALPSGVGAMDHPEADATGFDGAQAVSMMESLFGVMGQNRCNSLVTYVPELEQAKADAAGVNEEFLDALHGVRTVTVTMREGNESRVSFDFDNLTVSIRSQVPVSVLTQNLTDVTLNHPFFAANPQYAEYLSFVRRIPTNIPTVQTTLWNLNNGSTTLTVTEPDLGSCDFPFSSVAFSEQLAAKRVLYIIYRQHEVMSHHVI